MQNMMSSKNKILLLSSLLSFSALTFFLTHTHTHTKCSFPFMISAFCLILKNLLPTIILTRYSLLCSNSTLWSREIALRDLRENEGTQAAGMCGNKEGGIECD